MKTGRKTLSVFMSVLMFALTFVAALVPVSAANDLNNQIAGGVSVVFLNSTDGNLSQTNVFSVDPSDGMSYYVRLINRSNRDATIVAMNNTDKLADSSPVGLVIPADEYVTRRINKSLLGTTDGALYDFSVAYNLADVYDSDGSTIYRFFQPAYIGVWNSSDDSRFIDNSEDSGGNTGFTLAQSEQDIANTFMTDIGIIERAKASTGNRTAHVDFEYNYWIDTTGITKTWETLGFRLFVQKWGDRRQHLQTNDAPGRLSIEGNMGDTSASLSMADLVTSYGGASDWFNYPAADRPWATVGSPCTPHWDGQSSTKYATLWDSGDSAHIRFCGNMWTGSSTSVNPGKIVFTNMQWRKPSIAGSLTTRNVTFTGTINTYIYDKTDLREYIAAIGGVSDFAPMNGRYNTAVWNDYNTALREAMRVLANYKTTQYDVTNAYHNLVTAVSALQDSSNLTRQIVSVTDRVHSGDKSSSVTSSTTRYILAPLGSYSVPHSASAKNIQGINKCTDPVDVNYTTSDTGLNSVGTYDYWSIDFSDLDSVKDSAEQIINKQWCYSADYISSITSAKAEVDGIDTTPYSSSPESQTVVSSAVANLNGLVLAEAAESNHSHVAGDWQLVDPATCTEDGLQAKYCIYCGAKITEEIILSSGHKFSSWEIEQQSNCKEQGLMTRTCQNEGCGRTETEILPIDPTNHKGPSDLRGVIEGNCGNAGYTGDLYCEACGVLVEKGHTVPATNNHSEIPDGSMDGTCIISGYIRYKCTECGNIRTVDTGTDADNHIGTRTTLNQKTASCSEDGYTGDVYCDDCNEIVEHGTVISSTGHTPGEWVVKTEATCGEDGEEVQYCTVCYNIANTRPIYATGKHNYITIKDAKPATCSEEGYTAEIVCSVCSDVQQKSTVIQKTSHTYPADWDEVAEPVCGTPGYKVMHCVTCGEEIAREEIPATTSHEFVYVEGSRFEATCVTEGSEQYKCSKCDYVETRTLSLNPNNHETDETVIIDKIDATCGKDGYTGDICHKCCDVLISFGSVVSKTNNHSWVETSRDESTCITEGAIYYECSVCGNTRIEHLKIDPTNHVNTELRNKVSATCKTAGYSGDLWCSDCNTLIENGVVVPASSHEPGRTVVFRHATCTSDGLVDIYCKHCDEHMDSAVVPATGHTAVIDAAVAPTCTNQGLTQGSHCSSCGIILIGQQTISALGHTAGAWTVINDANCGNEGLREQYCITCGEMLASEVIPVTGEHHYELTESVVSTCSTPGHNLYECSVCGNSITETLSIDPENHEGPEIIVNLVNVTCGADGYTGDKICEACGELLESGVSVPATGLHVYDDGTFITIANKDHNGIKRFSCTGCDEYYDVEIVWTPHTHHGGESGATCTVRAKCTECGQPYGEYNNSKHTGLRNVDAVDATCITAGHGEGVYCDTCLKYVTDPTVIPALGHVDANGDEKCDVCFASVPKVITSENFRCSYCDTYESHQDSPAKFIYAIVHAIVHFLESIFIF